jgi:hypothetical protein
MHAKQSPKEYRQFGLLLAGIVGGIFGLLLPWWHNTPIPHGPFNIALPLMLLALLRPQLLKPFYIFWMRVGSILGWINTRILLTGIFFVIILPLGLVKRLVSKDLMARQYDKTIPTYRVVSVPQKSETMEKPY